MDEEGRRRGCAPGEAEERRGHAGLATAPRERRGHAGPCATVAKVSCNRAAQLDWLLLGEDLSSQQNKRVGALSYASFALETIDDGFLQPAGTPRVQISPLGPMQADFELAYAASRVS